MFYSTYVCSDTQPCQTLCDPIPDAKNWLIWKDPDAGEEWRWEEKRTTEDEMVGWLDGITDSMDLSLSKVRELVMDTQQEMAILNGISYTAWLESLKRAELQVFSQC